MYLYNKHFTQNLIEGVHINAEEIIMHCESYNKNADIKKSVALAGNMLNASDEAYPCG